jgi:sirohydrochlorin ferrochelatase
VTSVAGNGPGSADGDRPTPPAGAAPALVAVAHGTRSPAGRRTMAQLRLAIAAQRPDLEIVPAYVDVHKPALPDVVTRLRSAGRPMVVLPLLLSTGFHVRIDIADAVGTAPGLARAAGPLGPDDILVAVLNQRLAEAGAGPGDAVVLAAAGSSDPGAIAQVEETAALLSARRGVPVIAGYLACAQPAVADAVRRARSTGRPVSIASYLLAPGHFSARLQAAATDHVAEPLGPHADIARLALRRYDEALAR